MLTEDYPIHRDRMRDWRVTVESPRRRDWMTANEDFRRYVLEWLREAGPLPGEALEDRAAVGWVSTGWTHGRNVERMLDTLWKQGVITVVGRAGGASAGPAARRAGDGGPVRRGRVRR